MNGAPTRTGRITIRTLVVMLLVTNGLLGFMVVTLSGDVSRLSRDAVRTDGLQAVDNRVAAIEQAITSVAQRSGSQTRTISDLDKDLEALELAVFGYSSSRAGIDALGKLEDRVDDVESCVNRIVSQLSSISRFPSFTFC